MQKRPVAGRLPEDDKAVYFLMEFISGAPLHHHFQAAGAKTRGLVLSTPMASGSG